MGRQIHPEASTHGGEPLYRAVDIAEALDDGLVDRVNIAASIIEGRHATLLESDITYFARRGFIGARTRPKLHGTLTHRQSRLARAFVVEHEQLIDEALGEAQSLQAMFPSLLYSIRRNSRGYYIKDSVEKVTGFSKEVMFGRLIPHLRADYGGQLDLLNKRVALCDVSQFDDERRDLLQSYLTAEERS